MYQSTSRDGSDGDRRETRSGAVGGGCCGCRGAGRCGREAHAERDHEEGCRDSDGSHAVPVVGGARAGLVTLATTAALVLGCAQPAEQPGADADVGAAPPAQRFQLPVSLNQVMVALVNDAADPIWVAAWRNPESERDWRALERLGRQLEIGGALLTVPGTGPMDAAWTSEQGWTAWSEELRLAGAGAVAAAEARDVEAISLAGDRIVEVCEGCHMQYKPDLPTGGEFGELSPTAADFEDEDAGEQPEE